MNTPTIPKPKKSHSKTAAYLMRSAFRTLHKGHKKNGIAIVRKLKQELHKIEMEIYNERATADFLKPKSTIKLICRHPCWIKKEGAK